MDNQYCMPDFKMDEEDYFMPSASKAKNSSMLEDEMFQLLWQNDQVVAHKSGKKSHGGGKAEFTGPELEADEVQPATEETARQHVFMQEDELASWLHYPLDEPKAEPRPGPRSFDRCSGMFDGFVHHPHSNTAAPSREYRKSASEINPQPPPLLPPPLPARRVDPEGGSKLQNFKHFSRLSRAAPRRIGSEPPVSSKAVENESTTTAPVAESNHTPTAVTVPTPRNSISKEFRICELRQPSSSGGSSANLSDYAVTPPPQAPPSTVEDRKRKGREEADDNINLVSSKHVPFLVAL